MWNSYKQSGLGCHSLGNFFIKALVDKVLVGLHQIICGGVYSLISPLQNWTVRKLRTSCLCSSLSPQDQTRHRNTQQGSKVGTRLVVLHVTFQLSFKKKMLLMLYCYSFCSGHFNIFKGYTFFCLHILCGKSKVWSLAKQSAGYCLLI